MLKKFKSSLLNNLKIFGPIILIIFTIIVTVLSNHQQKISENQKNNIVNNIYFKKTLNEISPKIFKFLSKDDLNFFSI